MLPTTIAIKVAPKVPPFSRETSAEYQASIIYIRTRLWQVLLVVELDDNFAQEDHSKQNRVKQSQET